MKASNNAKIFLCSLLYHYRLHRLCSVFCDVATCSRAECYRHFRYTYRLHHQCDKTKDGSLQLLRVYLKESFGQGWEKPSVNIWPLIYQHKIRYFKTKQITVVKWKKAVKLLKMKIPSHCNLENQPF